MLRIVLAALHLLALGIGLSAVWSRGHALRGPLDGASLRRAFAADGVWGAAGALWLGTGLWRLFGETEKATSYYFQNHIFLTKMGLFLLIVGLEVWPIITFTRWRRAARGVTPPDPVTARRVATISSVQAVLVVLIVFLAVAMARGYGARG
ncbi:MAG: DUF2214 family protein [Gemmatimonadaceae bacterium]